MSVRQDNPDTVVLYGHCPSEDAEPLLSLLSAGARAVDWRDCDSAHAAVVQVLIVAGIELAGPPRGEFLRRFVEPAIKAQ